MVALIVTSAIAAASLLFGLYQHYRRVDDRNDNKMVKEALKNQATEKQVEDLTEKVDGLVLTSTKFEAALTGHAQEEARIFGETNVKLAELNGKLEAVSTRVRSVEGDVSWIKDRMNGHKD